MEDDPAVHWREIRGDGFNGLVGPIAFARAADDAWQARLELEPRHMNSRGVCHGGVLLALADTAMGTATYEAGGQHPCATIELGGHFLAPAMQGQAALALVRQERRTRELSFMSAEIHAGGRVVMRASGIWKYLASGRPGTPRADLAAPG